jgi:predicted alpha/beta-fold hydrolase
MPSVSATEAYLPSTLLRVPDGGTIALDITPPNHNELPDSAPTVVVNHGLTGSANESYVRNVLAWVIKPTNEGGLGGRGVVINVSERPGLIILRTAR